MSAPFNCAVMRTDDAHPIANVITQQYSVAESFLAAIGALHEPCNFRIIHDQDRSKPAIKRRGTLEQHWNELCRWNNAGYGIFVTVAAMDGSGYDAAGMPIKDENGKTRFGDLLENVAAIRAHYADLDNLSAMANLQRASGHAEKPQFFVQSSPNKAHVYWVLSDSYRDNDWFSNHQAKLAQLYDGDQRITDPTRVMRLPGFYHLKGAPHLVTCHSLPGWGILTQPMALSSSLAAVNVVHYQIGNRKPLGDPDLAAPSLPLALTALDVADPNDMDRAQWVAFTAAFKQSIWTYIEPELAQEFWLGWCARYEKNDPGENRKQWNDLTETQVGWTWIERSFPQIAAQRMFGGKKPDQMPAMSDANSVTDDNSFLNEVNESTFGKPVSSEAFKLMREMKLNVGFNDFKQCMSVTGRLPWDSSNHVNFPRDWAPVDQAGLRMAIQQFPGMARIAKDQVEEALVAYVDRRRFNPVTDYLSALKWDEIPRLDALLTHYFNADDIEFASLVGPKFLIGMVARAMRPGCKRDEVLILEGNQGTLKSTALNVLAGGDAYFADHLPDVNSKDAIIQLHGNWLIEIGELSALRKSEAEDIKRFIVSRTDKYRPPFGRVSIEVPRTSVMAGTTNADTYLKDPTGARRFWPVRCGSIDLDGLRRDRDQLFAEAMVRFQAGERWWLEGVHELQSAAMQTEARQERDEWYDDILAYLMRMELCGNTITMRGVMEDGLGITDPNLKRRGTTGRIAAILRAEGYRRTRDSAPGGGKRSWIYQKT